MNQELYDTLVESLHLAYYNRDMEAVGDVRYDNAFRVLAETWPEHQKIWWKENQARFLQ